MLYQYRLNSYVCPSVQCPPIRPSVRPSVRCPFVLPSSVFRDNHIEPLCARLLTSAEADAAVVDASTPGNVPLPPSEATRASPLEAVLVSTVHVSPHPPVHLCLPSVTGKRRSMRIGIRSNIVLMLPANSPWANRNTTNVTIIFTIRSSKFISLTLLDL